MVLLNSAIGNFIYSNGRKYSYYGANNYLGLANHPFVTEASTALPPSITAAASRHSK